MQGVPGEAGAAGATGPRVSLFSPSACVYVCVFSSVKLLLLFRVSEDSQEREAVQGRRGSRGPGVCQEHQEPTAPRSANPNTHRTREHRGGVKSKGAC